MHDPNCIKILALNCGSSSLKFGAFEVNSKQAMEVGRGRVAIGPNGKIKTRIADGENSEEDLQVANQGDATRVVFDRLKSIFEPEAIGHRVVHGGIHFTEPVAIDKRVLRTLEGICLAPLHNGPALEVIRASREIVGDSIPMVAAFDTAFHSTLPAHARYYAIPKKLSLKHNLWRFGFHGLAYRWMLERYFVLTKANRHSSKVIALQLGSGCSAAAILNGQSIETSMGLTPLEGLMMATRSGDIDPSLPATLAELEGVDAREVDQWLNTRSGLLGVSNVSARVERLLEEENEENDSHLALEMFCHRIRKCIGAFLAVLGGADAILFGGGIGENAPAIRSRICKGMEWCGLFLDEQHNREAVGRVGCVSSGDSKMKAYVVPVNEEAIIARDTFQCIRSLREG